MLFCLAALSSGGQDNVAELSSHARDALLGGRYEEAIHLYEQMVKALPREPGVRLNLAVALDAAGRHREALTNLEQLRAAEAANPNFWFLLGIEYQKLQQPAKAVVPLERAASMDPANAQFRLELADAYLASGANSQAEAAFRKLSREQPDNAKALEGLALSLLAMSRAAFDALEAIAPASPFYRALRELAEADQGNAGKALAPSESPAARAFQQGEMQRVLSLTASSKQPEMLYWRARACSQLTNEALGRLAALPQSAEVHELRARVLRQARRWQESAAELREACRMSPRDSRLRGELAEGVWLSRNYDEAARILSELVKAGPEHARWQFQLGDSLFNLGRPEQALIHLRKAVDLSPSDLPMQAALGRLLLQMGDDQEAVSHLEKAAPLDKDGSIHYQLATAYRNVGKADLARRALARQQELQKAVELK